MYFSSDFELVLSSRIELRLDKFLTDPDARIENGNKSAAPLRASSQVV